MRHLGNLLFIDIETASCAPSYAQLPEAMQPLWQRRAKRIDEQAEPEALFEQAAGLVPEFGKIICIAVGYFVNTEQGETGLRVKSFAGDDEREVLAQFKHLLESKFDRKTRLVAHNGKEFDYPYLCKRMLINGMALPEILDLAGAKPWEVRHLDTMEMWRFGERRGLVSLKLLAAVFGIAPGPDTIDGSMVNQIYYTERNLPRIAAYCRRDVIVTAQVFLAMQTLPPIKAEYIVEIG